MHEQLLTHLQYVAKTYMPMYPRILKEATNSSIVHCDSPNSHLHGQRNPQRNGHFEFYRKPRRIQNNSFTTERENKQETRWLPLLP